MSSAIHLIAALVVIVCIPFVGYLHYQMHHEVRVWRKASTALGSIASPTRVLLDEDVERRIRALEEDRGAFALAFDNKWKLYEQKLYDVEQSIKTQRTTIAALEAKRELLTKEIALLVQKVEVMERNPIDANGRLTMWGSQ